MLSSICRSRPCLDTRIVCNLAIASVCWVNVIDKPAPWHLRIMNDILSACVKIDTGEMVISH